MAVKPIPEGYHTITPYLIVKDAAKLIDFLRRAFGAEEVHRMNDSDGALWHAELRVGDSKLMLSEATDKWKPMPGSLYLYVVDTDGTYKRALLAGATSITEPADQFYGDRNAGIKDPSGNQWWISTRVEEVSPEEMKKRAAKEMAKREVMAAQKN